MAANTIAAKTFKVIVKRGDPKDNETLAVEQGAGDKGQPLRIKARAGAKYELQDLDKQSHGPEHVDIKRVGKDLHIAFENDRAADVIIEDYYSVMPEGYNGVIGQAESGSYYEYIPEDPNPEGLLPWLTDGGNTVTVALGGSEVSPAGAAVAAFALSPLMAAGAAGGAAAAAAVANKGGNDGGTGTGALAAPGSYVDNVGSIQSQSSTATTTDDTTPGFNIGKNLSGTPKLYVDGKQVDATYDSKTGTLTPNAPLGEGTHQITYVLTDNAGNITGTSDPLTVTIDTTPPATPGALGSYQDNVGSYQNDASTAASTDDTTPGFNVGKGLTDHATLYVDGKKIEATYDTNTGTLTPIKPLDAGAHLFTYTLTDAAGNESGQSPALNLVILGAAPATPTSYADNVGSVQDPNSTAATTDDTTPGINIGKGLTSQPTLYVDGQKVAATYDSATGTLTPNSPLADGTHAIAYTLTDGNGVETPPSGDLTIKIVTGTVPATPAAPVSYQDNVGAVQSDTSTAAHTDDATPGINIGAGLTNTPSLYVDGKKVDAVYDTVNGTLTPKMPLGTGTHSLTYSLSNSTGESGQSQPLIVTIDSVAPDAPTSYKDNVGSVQSDTSTATTTDDTTPGFNIGKSISGTPNLYVDGVEVPSTYDPATGTLTPNNPLGEGTHVVTYSITDTGGNEGPTSQPVTLGVDTLPPTKPNGPVSYKDNVGSVQSDASTAATTDDTTPGFNVGTGVGRGEKPDGRRAG